jgi:hypothetical protein
MAGTRRARPAPAVVVSHIAEPGQSADQRVLQALARVPKGPAPGVTDRQTLLPLTMAWPPRSFALRPVADYWFVAPAPVADNALQMELASVDPAFDIHALDVQGVDNVRLAIVAVPRELAAAKPAEASYLYFWRPRPNVSGDRYGPSFAQSATERYPYTFDFGFYGVWNYLSYRADPLTYREERWVPSRQRVRAYGSPFDREVEEKFTFGLPYQMRRAGKPMILVQPIFGLGDHPGGLAHAGVSSALLQAVHDWVWRERPPADRPTIGGVALAGYSAAAQAVVRFAAEHAASPLMQTHVKDLLLFDPPSGATDTFATHGGKLDTWLRGAASGVRRVALYSQVGFEGLPRHVPRPGGMGSPALLESRGWRWLFSPLSRWTAAQDVARKADRTRVAGALRALRDLGFDASPAAGEVRARSRAVVRDAALEEYARANRMNTYFSVHFAIPAMMLTDALRTTPA